MRIYVSHSKTFDYIKKLYNPIIKNINLNHNEFIFPHSKDYENINTKDIIKKCDIMIAEISKTAIGVGIELGRAEASNIRIIAIIKKGIKCNSSVKRLTSEIIIYKNKTDLMNKLEDVINKK